MAPPRPYSTLLFDFDHTLFDSDAAEAGAFARTLLAHGVANPASHYDDYRRINRALWNDVERGERLPAEVGVLRFVLLAELLGIDASPDDMATTYLDELGANGDLYPGARAVLEHLAERAVLAIITNAISSVQRARLRRLDLEACFSTVVISSEVGISKPHPGIFDIAFARLDQPSPAQMLMIGDSLTSDMRGGTNAGIATCWYNPGRGGEANADVTHEIADLAELASFVTTEPRRPL